MLKNTIIKKGSKFETSKVKQLPESPGIYIFSNLKDKPIYVGKSFNLKERIRSYFSKSLLLKTKNMVNEARKISYIKVSSELEALLLESKLIKLYKPKYNSISKDDKNPLYIKITKDSYPKVLTARKIEEKENNIAFFGPFPKSNNVRSVLKLIRKIFPYSDHKIGKRGCLYSQIGLCNPCPSEIEKTANKNQKEVLVKEYKSNIRYIKRFLSGDFKSIKRSLEKRMNNYSKVLKFENAAKVRDQIEKIDYITQPITPASRFITNPNLIEDLRKNEIKMLKNILNKYIRIKNIKRIECYDVSHLSGTYPTASMVTFINSEPDKSMYRHFKIRQKKVEDDISSMKEVAKRRVKYLKIWGEPDLIIVDGGKAQVNVFYNIFRNENIPVIGIAKRFESLIVPSKSSLKNSYVKIRMKRGPALFLVQRLRNEAHRFARKYHHILIRKKILN
jgi:excinuclease ABC subunit C